MRILAMQGFDHLNGVEGTLVYRTMPVLLASGWNIPNTQAPSNLNYAVTKFQGRTWLQHVDTVSGSNTNNYSTQYLASSSYATVFNTRATTGSGVLAFRLWIDATSKQWLSAWQPMVNYAGATGSMTWFTKLTTEGVYVIEIEVDQTNRKVNVYVDGLVVESFAFSSTATIDSSITFKLERYKNGNVGGVRAAITDFVLTHSDDPSISARLGSVEVLDLEINKPSIPKTWSVADDWDVIYDLEDGSKWATSPILPNYVIDTSIDGIWGISLEGVTPSYATRGSGIHLTYLAIGATGDTTYTCHFTDARKVTGFLLMSYGSNPTFDKVVIQVSDDGVAWRTIDTRENLSATLLKIPNKPIPFKFRTADAGAYKHIRMVASKAASVPAATTVYMATMAFLGDVADKGTNLHPYILMQNVLGSSTSTSWDGKSPAWMSSIDGSELSLSLHVKDQFDNATILAVQPSVLAAKVPGGTDKLAVNYAVGNKTTAQLEYTLTNSPADVVTKDILLKAPSGNGWTVEDIVNGKLVIKGIKGD